MSSGAGATIASDASEPDGLTSGFYLLALVLVVLSMGEVRLRAPGLPSFTALELVAYPMALCLAAEAMLRPRLAEQLGHLYRLNRPLVWYAGYAAVASVLGLARSADTLQAYKDLAPGLVLYAVLFLTVTTPERAIGALLAGLAGALLNLAIGASQVIVGGPHPVEPSDVAEIKLDTTGNIAGRVAIGLVAHPNGLALLLIPAVLFLVLATWPGFEARRRVSFGMLGLLVFVFLVVKMTYAKGAYAWMVAGLLFLVVPPRLDRARAGIAVGVIVCGIAALLWLSISRLMDGEIQYGTVLGRIGLWLTAIDVIGSDGFVALLGNGSLQMKVADLNTNEIASSHNVWLNQALTYGVPALAFYLAGFWVALRGLARVISVGMQPWRIVALGTMASLTAIFGDYFFEAVDRGVVFQAQLFALYAMAAVCQRATARRLACVGALT